MIDLMCWAASRALSAGHQLEQDSLPGHESAVPYDYGFPPHEMGLSNGRSDRDRFSRASIDGRGRFSEHVGSLFPPHQSVERRSSEAPSALAGSDFAGSDLACSAFGSDFTGSSLTLSTAGVSTRAVTS